jgi:hypothetical protein
MSPEEIAEAYVTPRVVQAYDRASRMLGTKDVIVFRDAEGDLQTFRRETFLRHHPCESLKEPAIGDMQLCFWYVIQLEDEVAYLNITVDVKHDVH